MFQLYNSAQKLWQLFWNNLIVILTECENDIKENLS